MEENNQNQNNDAQKPVEPQAPVSNVDGFVTSPRPAEPAPQAQVLQTEAAASVMAALQAPSEQAAPAPTNEVAKLKKEKKGMAVWLVILLVVLVAGAASAAVYFYQANKAKSDLDAQKAQTAQVQKQLVEQEQSATQQQITALNQEVTTLKSANAALQKSVDAQAAYIKTLTTTATQLKTACGATCSAITIPPAPTLTPPTTTTTN